MFPAVHKGICLLSASSLTAANVADKLKQLITESWQKTDVLNLYYVIVDFFILLVLARKLANNLQLFTATIIICILKYKRFYYNVYTIYYMKSTFGIQRYYWTRKSDKVTIEQIFKLHLLLFILLINRSMSIV